MHAIKGGGGWGGQAFALAKCNESEGRKTRIRRSKEERKAMVETFIKKYQKSNNGRFPSLNLTHKEVGGSFYTVREIVRDIIQENRVLGPGKFAPEEESTDQLLEQQALDSIAVECQASLTLPSNDNHFVSNFPEVKTPELNLVTDQHCTDPEDQISQSEAPINDIEADIERKKCSEQIDLTFQVNAPIQAENNVDVESGPVSEKANAIATDIGALTATRDPIAVDVVVETFPLRPITRADDISDERSEEVNLTNPLEAQETEIADLTPGSVVGMEGKVSIITSPLVREKSVNLGNQLTGENHVLIEKEVLGNSEGVESLNGSVRVSDHDLVEEVALKNRGEPKVEGSNGSVHVGDVEIQGTREVSSTNILTSAASEQGHLTAATKGSSSPNGIPVKELNGSCSNGITQQLVTEEDIKHEDKGGLQNSGGSKEENLPTLHRISLDSWDGASKTPAKQESNPLLAVFKAFVAAFVKFWSD